MTIRTVSSLAFAAALAVPLASYAQGAADVEQAGMSAHEHLMHETAPHVVTIQSQLDAATAQNRGIDQLARSNAGAMNSTYRDHVSVLGSAIESELNTAHVHVEHLRMAVEQSHPSQALRNDLAQLDQAVTQARQKLDALRHAQSSGDATGSRLSPLSADLERSLSHAKSAMQRIDSALHR